MSSNLHTLDNMVIIIGAMKCGTTSLRAYLALHPEIGMAHMKEVDFFIANANWKRGWAWYRSKLKSRKRLWGESSANYSKYHYFPGVPERMHMHVPSAKLLYLVRDPIKRILSHYIHNVAKGREVNSLERALERPVCNHYVLTSCYMQQLDKFLKHYREDQIHVVSLEELSANKTVTLKKVFQFLEVDDDFTHPGFDSVHNTSSRKKRPNALGRRLMALPGGRYIRYALRSLLEEPLGEHPLPDDVREQLVEVLSPDVDRLRSFTGKDFGKWSI